ncbi:MAG: hypothetical protein R3231_12405 [bacterium]|nr:hypothetical protein [bacterium]
MSFQMIALQSQQELISLIKKSCTAIEGDLEILGENLGDLDFPLIDLVARDAQGLPLLIYAGLEPREEVLFAAGDQAAWFVKNRTLLQRIFPTLSFDQSVLPRAALIYPEYSQSVKRFVRAAPPSLTPLLYRYRCFETDGQRHLYLEKIVPAGRRALKAGQPEDGLPPFRTGIFGDPVHITREEREAFYR